MHMKGSMLYFPNYEVFLIFLKIVCSIFNSADPSKMPCSVAVHLGLHFLKIFLLGASILQRVDDHFHCNLLIFNKYSIYIDIFYSLTKITNLT